jgi:hypothetical protein
LLLCSNILISLFNHLICSFADDAECINKPSQFGAFVLSYLKKIMQFYNTQLDPTLKKFTVSYTYTDSLHISEELHKQMKNK